MDIKSLYREIVNEHNLHPTHKHDIAAPTMVLNGVNPSCGDDINLQLLIEDGVIADASFNGSGCAVSQASADMMCDLVIGQSTEDALALAANFKAMIHGEATDEQKESLDEAASLEDVSHMPARVKCAMLGWRTMKEMIDQIQKDGVAAGPVVANGSEACGACTVPGCDKKQ